MLTADAILGARDIQTAMVKVPEWGGEVCVKMLTGAERDAWELYAEKETAKVLGANIRAKLASLVLCDEAGKRLFTDAQVKALSEKSGNALDRVFEAAIRLNRISAEDVKDLEKN